LSHTDEQAFAMAVAVKDVPLEEPST
jgi:hypothetical protein